MLTRGPWSPWSPCKVERWDDRFNTASVCYPALVHNLTLHCVNTNCVFSSCCDGFPLTLEVSPVHQLTFSPFGPGGPWKKKKQRFKPMNFWYRWSLQHCRKRSEQTWDFFITKYALINFHTKYQGYSRDSFFTVIIIVTVQLFLE